MEDQLEPDVKGTAIDIMLDSNRWCVCWTLSVVLSMYTALSRREDKGIFDIATRFLCKSV
jgi:hypothetical protein